MYAIFLNNNKQYTLERNNLVKVDLIKSNVGEIIKTDKILFLKDDINNIIGTPYLEKKELVFEVVKHVKDKKKIILKFKRRKNYMKKTGHRQKYTILKFLSLTNKEV